MPRILVIDDERMVRILLREVLERAGHEVLEATDGAMGLEIFEGEPTDLIITDIRMPGMGGLEFISALRSHRCCRRRSAFPRQE
jgi:two-component system response regulator (stage 0 sporulation protein F)